MTPTQRYQHDVDHGRIFPDPAQRLALQHLQRLYDELLPGARTGNSWLQSAAGRLLGRRPARAEIRSLYFWGDVGRGKTYLMDIFYEALPGSDKQRTHFHRFMQQVHRELTRLKGTRDPLREVARGLAAHARIICFDEFFVSDIGDAMILAGLLEALFELGTVFVMTSNIEPRRLYENGLQRDRFIPAIALIQSHAEVVELNGQTDYRLRHLSQASLYHWPLGGEAEKQMAASFRNLAPDFAEACEAEVVEILGRPLQSRYCSDDVIWFDFAELCEGPRSAFDYIELARIYHAILLSGIPVMDDSRNDAARRFINLVDELYDHDVKLIISAAGPLEQLYQGTGLAKVFQRTRSRLQEMQSRDYLARGHRP